MKFIEFKNYKKEVPMIESSVLLLREKSILFIDDDDIIRDNMRQTLKVLFKHVFVAADGKEAMVIYEDERPDIIFTDIQMPVMDGMTFANKVRTIDLITPIIFYTAYNESEYLLKAINLMTGGYLIKPSSLDEMIVVFSRSLRKTMRSSEFVTDLKGGIAYNQVTRELYKNGEQIALSTKEEALLKLFIVQYPKTLSKDFISQELWPLESVGITALKNIIGRLRTKIGEEKIVSVRGIGWKLVID